MGKATPAGSDPEKIGHRGSYVLQRGVWHVTCQGCGWKADGPVRRQLASIFRFHRRAVVAQDGDPARPPEPGD